MPTEIEKIFAEHEDQTAAAVEDIWDDLMDYDPFAEEAEAGHGTTSTALTSGNCIAAPTSSPTRITHQPDASSSSSRSSSSNNTCLIQRSDTHGPASIACQPPASSHSQLQRATTVGPSSEVHQSAASSSNRQEVPSSSAGLQLAANVCTTTTSTIADSSPTLDREKLPLEHALVEDCKRRNAMVTASEIHMQRIEYIKDRWPSFPWNPCAEGVALPCKPKPAIDLKKWHYGAINLDAIHYDWKTLKWPNDSELDAGGVTFVELALDFYGVTGVRPQHAWDERDKTLMQWGDYFKDASRKLSTWTGWKMWPGDYRPRVQTLRTLGLQQFPGLAGRPLLKLEKTVVAVIEAQEGCEHYSRARWTVPTELFPPPIWILPGMMRTRLYGKSKVSCVGGKYDDKTLEPKVGPKKKVPTGALTQQELVAASALGLSKKDTTWEHKRLLHNRHAVEYAGHTLGPLVLTSSHPFRCSRCSGKWGRGAWKCLTKQMCPSIFAEDDHSLSLAQLTPLQRACRLAFYRNHAKNVKRFCATRKPDMHIITDRGESLYHCNACNKILDKSNATTLYRERCPAIRGQLCFNDGVPGYVYPTGTKT